APSASPSCASWPEAGGETKRSGADRRAALRRAPRAHRTDQGCGTQAGRRGPSGLWSKALRGGRILMTTAKALMATLGALFASAASAQAPAPAAFTVISPVFGQLVAFSMPSSFVVVSENANGPNYIREAVPKGETVDRWTQMITLTGVKG